MSQKYLVSSSPHIVTSLTTKKIMLHVIIALCFPLVASTIIFGFYSLFVVLLAVASSVAGESLFNLIRKKENTISDLSAVVTGLILGMNLPPTVPFYVPIVGAFFAIMVVKMLFGGLGKNFANPAATGRIFLSLSWTSQMTKFILPLDYANGFKDFFSGFQNTYITSATPLLQIKEVANGGILDVKLLNMFLGKIPGSIGEVCSLAIILAFIYLVVFKVIDWKIPVFYVLTCALMTMFLYKNGWNFILPSILSGGLLFSAVFMFTDYTTSPHTVLGRIIFAVGGGVFTMVIRRFGGVNEGACFSILLMNLLVPYIDKLTIKKPYGFSRKKEVKHG